MGTKIVRFVRLLDVKTVRFICKSGTPGAALEVPIDQLGKILGGGLCPICKNDVTVTVKAPSYRTNNPFALFVECINDLQRVAGVGAAASAGKCPAEIELVIPEDVSAGKVAVVMIQEGAEQT
jgi:hypothetical protein